MALLSSQHAPRSRGTTQPPRSRAFLLELLLNMLIFALCAVIALQVFVEGKLVTDESAALSRLTLDAQDLAGHYKVSSGDVSELASSAVRGGQGELSGDATVTFYYDSSLEPSDAANARYRLVLAPTAFATQTASAGDRLSAITITGYTLEEELFSFEVVNYQSQGGR